MSRVPGDTGWRERAAVASRVLAATVGAYAVTALVSAALARALVWMSLLSRADAVLWTTLGSFAFHAVAAIGVFAVASATRAWGWLGGIGLAAAVVLAATELFQG